MNPNQPYVSILIPLYNGVEYLQECLESVRQQTFTAWEVLIGINGHGCTGGEVASKVYALVEVMQSDPRIRVIVQGPPLKGKVESLNHLVVMAQSEWIALLDCDDKWEPMKLQRQMEAIQGEARDADVIGTQTFIFGDRTSAPVLHSGYIPPAILEDHNPIINSSALIRRAWCKWEYNQVNYAMEDYALWMKICLAGGKLYNVTYPALTWHRVYAESAFNSKQISPYPLILWYRQERQKQLQSSILP